MRLVRELLAADAEPALTQADAAGRARRYLEVVTSGLGLRAGALLLADPSGQRLVCAASTLPAAARALLEEQGGRDWALARRAADERRAFLVRRSSDDPLVSLLHEADAAVETVAILPLADRGTVGVLVLAGDEASLASESVRTLTPAVRLLALLASARRDGIGAAAPPADDGARAEQSAEIARLRARVAELERQLPGRGAAHPASATPSRRVEPAAEAPSPPAHTVAAPTSADDDRVRTILVLDVASDWEHHPPERHRVVVVAPSADSGTRAAAESPDRIVVNVAAAGALDAAAALRGGATHGAMLGVVADGGERVIGLGPLYVVERPPSADALVAAVERVAPRGARVFAAGRDADLFMRMRQVLAKAGLSVSMARETKQINELVTMVRPQVLVVDLGLPMREGYELVMRMAATEPVPVMVLIAPDGDPTPVFREKLRDRLAAGQGMGLKQWLGDVVAVAAKAAKPAAATTAAR